MRVLVKDISDDKILVIDDEAEGSFSLATIKHKLGSVSRKTFEEKLNRAEQKVNLGKVVPLHSIIIGSELELLNLSGNQSHLDACYHFSLSYPHRDGCDEPIKVYPAIKLFLKENNMRISVSEASKLFELFPHLCTVFNENKYSERIKNYIEEINSRK